MASQHEIEKIKHLSGTNMNPEDFQKALEDLTSSDNYAIRCMARLQAEIVPKFITIFAEEREKYVSATGENNFGKHAITGVASLLGTIAITFISNAASPAHTDTAMHELLKLFMDVINQAEDRAKLAAALEQENVQ